MASNLFGRLLGKVWASCSPLQSPRLRMLGDTRVPCSSRTSVSRENQRWRSWRGTRFGSCCAFVFFLWRRRCRSDDAKKSDSEEPCSRVFRVRPPSEAIRRTLLSRLARSESILFVRAGLEQPVFESYSGLLDAGFSTFLPRPRPLSLFSLDLSQPFSLDLSLLLFSPSTSTNSPPPPRPWAAPTTTRGTKSPQRPSSA